MVCMPIPWGQHLDLAHCGSLIGIKRGENQIRLRRFQPNQIIHNPQV